MPTIPIITRPATITHATPEAVLAWLAQERYAAVVERTIQAVQHRIAPQGKGEER